MTVSAPRPTPRTIVGPLIRAVLNGIGRNMKRILTILLALATPCFGRDYWNGTKEGMSKAALMKLYGKRLKPYTYLYKPLKPYPEAWAYTTETPESFCGGNFWPYFYFDENNPKQGLAYVVVVLEGGNANGSVGDCVLKHYTAKYEHPKKSAEIQGPGQYGFSGARIILNISPWRIEIDYRGSGCRWWQFNCGDLVL
jgi:hypothetical protein